MYDGVAPDVHIFIDGKFIEAVKDAGANFSSSLVIASFCHSASSSHMSGAFGAQSFIGADGTIDIFASAMFVNFIVESLAEKTHTPLYSLDLLLDASDYNLFWPFGKKYEKPLEKTSADNYQVLRGVGPGGAKYDRLTEQELAVISMIREPSVISGDPVDGAGVDHCYEEFWSKKKRAGLAEPWCDRGVISDFPTADDVADAKADIIGVPRLASGRYTLNDAKK